MYICAYVCTYVRTNKYVYVCIYTGNSSNKMVTIEETLLKQIKDVITTLTGTSLLRLPHVMDIFSILGNC
jgi:hypothetical protein